MKFKDGSVHHNILLETIPNKGENSGSFIRVRPAETFPKDWRVNFPKSIRDSNPIGTRFRATVTVKLTRANSNQPFLIARPSSIITLSEMLTSDSEISPIKPKGYSNTKIQALKPKQSNQNTTQNTTSRRDSKSRDELSSKNKGGNILHYAIVGIVAVLLISYLRS